MDKPFEKWTSQCGRVTLYRGDCLDVMPTIEADSVDSVISDPPYGLRFMGKKWDHGVPGVLFWEAARRIMKPGAMLLAFGGTRTVHRLVCAIEDAGLEIRDGIAWHFGSGFPKSLDISKSLDKAVGAVREVVGHKGGRYNSPGTDIRGGNLVGGKAGILTEWGSITAPATPAAKTWDGYGTALKPATEWISLAMKPLDGTYAANALKHGVAGLNIDGGRIGISDTERPIVDSTSGGERVACNWQGPGKQREIGEKFKSHVSGRWPANVILDEAAAAELDAQSGVLTSGAVAENRNTRSLFNTSETGKTPLSNWMPASSGGASRFFYVAKPSRAERNAGLEGENHHPTCKPVELLRYLARLTKTPRGGAVLDPFMGSGSTGVAAVLEGRRFIGIEKEPEYFEICKRRLAHALAEAQSDMFAGVEVG